MKTARINDLFYGAANFTNLLIATVVLFAVLR